MSIFFMIDLGADLEYNDSISNNANKFSSSKNGRGGVKLQPASCYYLISTYCLLFIINNMRDIFLPFDSKRTICMHVIKSSTIGTKSKPGKLVNSEISGGHNLVWSSE